MSGRKFKASNGWYIDESGELRDRSDDMMLYASEVQPAEQFFIERRDAELGRWRSKKDPNWTAVLAPAIDYVYFTNEDGLRSFGVANDTRNDTHWSPDLREIAREYFDAHPRHKPLPTVEGFYVNRSLFVQQVATASILVHFEDGGWGFDDDLGSDATAIAQEWHDAGELVRLTVAEADE